MTPNHKLILASGISFENLMPKSKGLTENCFYSYTENFEGSAARRGVRESDAARVTRAQQTQL